MLINTPAKNYIQRLPYEIVEKITQLLSKKDAFQCMLVCKSWHSAALPVFYKTVSIDYEQLIELGPQLIALSKSLRSHPKLARHGKLIKSIRIEDKDTIPDFQAYTFLAQLLWHTRNVNTIDLSLCKDIRQYLFCLTQMATRNFVKSLGHIKFFSPYNFYSGEDFSPGHWNLGHLYLNACYNFMDSLTHLELHDIHSKIYFGAVDRSPLEFLDYFPQLTHLTLSSNEAKYLHSDSEPPLEEECILQYVLENCENLQSFNLLHYHSPRSNGNYGGTSTYDESRMVSSDPWENLMIGRYQQQGKAIERQNGILRISEQMEALLPYILRIQETLDSLVTGSIDYRHHNNKQVLFPKLKQLTYVSSEFCLEEVQFISESLSTKHHLKNVTLVVNRLCALEWFNQIGLENAFRFAHYLGPVNHLQFKFSEKRLDSHTRLPFPLLEACSPVQEMWTRTLLWKFIDTIKGASRSDDLKYSIFLDVSPKPLLFYPKTRFTVNKANKSIHLEQTITMNSFLYSDFVSNLNNPSRIVAEIPPPDHVFLPEVAQETRILKIRLPPSDCLREFQCALKNFTQLYQLIILSETKPSPYISKCSIECHKIYTKSPGHTQATLTHIYLTPAFQQVLVESLPYLECLTLIDCDFFDSKGFISRHCLLDLRHLSNLQNLRIAIQTNTSSYNKVHVRVEYYVDQGAQHYDTRGYWVQDILMNKPSPPTQEVDYKTMTIIIRVCDKLQSVTFMKSSYHPPQAILS